MEKKRPTVGDRVRFCQDYLYVPKGTIGVIKKDDHSTIPFYVNFGLTSLWVHEGYVELVESAPTKPTLELKEGDTVRIKSRQWYDQNKDDLGCVSCNGAYFIQDMSKWCGTTHKIAGKSLLGHYYLEGCEFYSFTPDMFDLEGKPRFCFARKPLINGNIPLIKTNRLLTDIKLD